MEIKILGLSEEDIRSLEKIGFKVKGDVISIQNGGRVLLPEQISTVCKQTVSTVSNDEFVYTISYGKFKEEQPVATIKVKDGNNTEVSIDHDRINSLLAQMPKEGSVGFDPISGEVITKETHTEKKVDKAAQPLTQEEEDRKKHLGSVIAKLNALRAKEKDFETQAREEKNDKKKLKYTNAAQAISQISAHLDKLIKEYTAGNKDLASFKLAIKNMRTAPGMANNIKTLESHRGTKQLLLNILSAIFTLGVSLVYGAMTGKHNFSIFKAPTDSSKKLQEVDQEIDKIPPISKT